MEASASPEIDVGDEEASWKGSGDALLAAFESLLREIGPAAEEPQQQKAKWSSEELLASCQALLDDTRDAVLAFDVPSPTTEQRPDQWPGQRARASLQSPAESPDPLISAGRSHSRDFQGDRDQDAKLVSPSRCSHELGPAELPGDHGKSFSGRTTSPPRTLPLQARMQLSTESLAGGGSIESVGLPADPCETATFRNSPPRSEPLDPQATSHVRTTVADAAGSAAPLVVSGADAVPAIGEAHSAAAAPTEVSPTHLAQAHHTSSTSVDADLRSGGSSRSCTMPHLAPPLTLRASPFDNARVTAAAATVKSQGTATAGNMCLIISTCATHSQDDPVAPGDILTAPSNSQGTSPTTIPSPTPLLASEDSQVNGSTPVTSQITPVGSGKSQAAGNRCQALMDLPENLGVSNTARNPGVDNPARGDSRVTLTSSDSLQINSTASDNSGIDITARNISPVNMTSTHISEVNMTAGDRSRVSLGEAGCLRRVQAGESNESAPCGDHEKGLVRDAAMAGVSAGPPMGNLGSSALNFPSFEVALPHLAEPLEPLLSDTDEEDSLLSYETCSSGGDDSCGGAWCSCCESNATDGELGTDAGSEYSLGSFTASCEALWQWNPSYDEEDREVDDQREGMGGQESDTGTVASRVLAWRPDRLSCQERGVGDGRNESGGSHLNQDLSPGDRHLRRARRRSISGARERHDPLCLGTSPAVQHGLGFAAGDSPFVTGAPRMHDALDTPCDPAGLGWTCPCVGAQHGLPPRVTVPARGPASSPSRRGEDAQDGVSGAARGKDECVASVPDQLRRQREVPVLAAVPSLDRDIDRACRDPPGGRAGGDSPHHEDSDEDMADIFGDTLCTVKRSNRKRVTVIECERHPPSLDDPLAPGYAQGAGKHSGCSGGENSSGSPKCGGVQCYTECCEQGSTLPCPQKEAVRFTQFNIRSLSENDNKCSAQQNRSCTKESEECCTRENKGAVDHRDESERVIFRDPDLNLCCARSKAHHCRASDESAMLKECKSAALAGGATCGDAEGAERQDVDVCTAASEAQARAAAGPRSDPTAPQPPCGSGVGARGAPHTRCYFSSPRECSGMPSMLLPPACGEGDSEPASVERGVEEREDPPPACSVRGEGDAGAFERCGGGACSPECVIRGTCGIGNESDLVHARPVRVLEEGEHNGGERGGFPSRGVRGARVRGSEDSARKGETPAAGKGRARRERTSVLVDGCDLARRPHGNECQVLQQTGTGGGCAGSRSHDTVGEAHAPRYPGAVIGSVLVSVGEILWEYPVLGSDDEAACDHEEGDGDQWLLVLSDQDWEAAINSDGELVTMSSDNESVAGSRPPHTSTAPQHPDINKCQSSIYGFKIAKNENVKVKKLLPIFTSSRSSSSQNITNSVTFRVKGDSTWQTSRANRNSDVCDMQILGSRPASPDPYPLFRSATLPRKMPQARYSSMPPGTSSRAMSPLLSPVSSQIFEFPSASSVPPGLPSAQGSSAAARQDESTPRNGHSENAPSTQGIDARTPGDTGVTTTVQSRQQTQVPAPNGPCNLLENKSLEESETECVKEGDSVSSPSGAYGNSSSQSLPHFPGVPQNTPDKQDICTVFSKVPCDGDAKITVPLSGISVGGTVGGTVGVASGGPVAPGSDLDVTCGTTTCAQPKPAGNSTPGIEHKQPLSSASQSAIAQNDIRLRKMRTSENDTPQGAAVPLEEVTTADGNAIRVAPLPRLQEGDTKQTVDEKLIINEAPEGPAASPGEGAADTCLRIVEPIVPPSSDFPSQAPPPSPSFGQTSATSLEEKAEAEGKGISADSRSQERSQKGDDVIAPALPSLETLSKKPGKVRLLGNSAPSELDKRLPSATAPPSGPLSVASSDAASVPAESRLNESKQETAGQDSHYTSTAADRRIALQGHVHGNEGVIRDVPCVAKESQAIGARIDNAVENINKTTIGVPQGRNSGILQITEPVREDATSTESANVAPSPVKLSSSPYTQAQPLQDVSAGLCVPPQSCNRDNELCIIEDKCISQSIEKEEANDIQTHCHELSIACNSATESSSSSPGTASASQPPAPTSDSDSVEGESNRAQTAEQTRASVGEDGAGVPCRPASSSDVPGEARGHEVVRGDTARLSDSGASDVDGASDKQLVADKCISDETKARTVTPPPLQRNRSAGSIGGGRGRTPSREESVGAEPSAPAVGRGPGISERAALIRQQVCVRPRSRTTHFPLDIVCGTKLQSQQARTKLDPPDRVARQRNSSLGHVQPLVVERDATARSKSASRIGSGSSEAVAECLGASQEDGAGQEPRGAPHAAARSESCSRTERALPPIPRPFIAPLDAALKNKIKMTIDSCGDSCSGSELAAGAAPHARGEPRSPAVDRCDSGNESSVPHVREIVTQNRKAESQPTENRVVRDVKNVDERNEENNGPPACQNGAVKSKSEMYNRGINIIVSGPEVHENDKVVTKDVNEVIQLVLKDENNINTKETGDVIGLPASSSPPDVIQALVVDEPRGAGPQAGVSGRSDSGAVISNQNETPPQRIAKGMTVIMLPAVRDHIEGPVAEGETDATPKRVSRVDTDVTLPISVKGDVIQETAVKDKSSATTTVRDQAGVTQPADDKVLPTSPGDLTPPEKIKVSAEVASVPSTKNSSGGVSATELSAKEPHVSDGAPAPTTGPSSKEPQITPRRSQGRMPTPVCLPPSRASGGSGFGPESWLNAIPLKYGRESEKLAAKTKSQGVEGKTVKSEKDNHSEGSLIPGVNASAGKNELFIEEGHVDVGNEAKEPAGGEVVAGPIEVPATGSLPRRRARDSLLLNNQTNILFIDESAPDLCDQEVTSTSDIKGEDKSGVDLLQPDVCVTSGSTKDGNEGGRKDIICPSVADEFGGSAVPSHARPVDQPATRDDEPGREGSQDDYEQALEVATPDPGHGFSHSCTSVATVVRVDTPNQQPPSRPPPPEDDEAEDVFVDASDDVALVVTDVDTSDLPEVDQHQQLQASSPTLMEASPATSEHSAGEADFGKGALSHSASETHSSGMSGTSSVEMSATSSRSMTGTQSTSSSGGVAKAVRTDARRPLVLIRKPGSDAPEDGSVSSGGHITDPDMMASASASASSTGSEASWTSSGGPVARRDLLPLDEDEDEVQWRALLAVNAPESEEERTGYESDEDFDTMDAEMRRLEEKLRRFEKELGNVPEDSSGASETKMKGSSGGPPGPMLRSEDLEALRISPLPKVFPAVCRAKTKHLSLMTKLDLQQYGESDSESDSESDRVSSDSDSADFLFVKTKIKLKPGDRKCRSLEQRRSKNMNILNESRDAKKREQKPYVCEDGLDLSSLAIPRDPAEDDSFSVGYEEQEKFDIPPPPPPPVGYVQQFGSDSDVGREPALPEGQDEPYPSEMPSDEMLDDDSTMYYSGEDQALLGYIWQEEDGMAAVDFEGLEDFQSFKGQSALMFMFEDDLDDDAEAGQQMDNGDMMEYELKQPAVESQACDDALPTEPPGGAPPRTRRGSQKSSDRTSGEYYAAPALCVNTSDEDPPAPPRRPQEALGQPPAPPPRWVQRRSYIAKDVDSDALMRRLSQTSQTSQEGCWFSTLPPPNTAPHPSFQAPVGTILPPHQVPPLLLPLSSQPLAPTAVTAPAQIPGFQEEMQFYLVGTPNANVDGTEPELRRRSRGTELEEVRQMALPVSPSHADSCPPPVTWAPGYYDKCSKIDNFPGMAPAFCPNHGSPDAVVDLPPGSGPPLSPTHRPTSVKQLKRKHQEKALRQEAEEGIEGCTFCMGVPLMRSRPPEDSSHWRQSSPHPRAITDRRSWPPRVSCVAPLTRWSLPFLPRSVFPQPPSTATPGQPCLFLPGDVATHADSPGSHPLPADPPSCIQPVCPANVCCAPDRLFLGSSDSLISVSDVLLTESSAYGSPNLSSSDYDSDPYWTPITRPVHFPNSPKTDSLAPVTPSSQLVSVTPPAMSPCLAPEPWTCPIDTSFQSCSPQNLFWTPTLYPQPFGEKETGHNAQYWSPETDTTFNPGHEGLPTSLTTEFWTPQLDTLSSDHHRHCGPTFHGSECCPCVNQPVEGSTSLPPTPGTTHTCPRECAARRLHRPAPPPPPPLAPHPQYGVRPLSASITH
ncbi:hypothetical protein C7M84_023694 [Penaeus vannamei]|uniref:Uncharacterized protein n=1 Tax=Penaeus vannamei TaxID=6689 RepID=A0A3R7MI02_PENVA|nr:hypothetical protein C7M84_023694 [Penaeus vannamei]